MENINFNYGKYIKTPIGKAEFLNIDKFNI